MSASPSAKELLRERAVRPWLVGALGYTFATGRDEFSGAVPSRPTASLPRTTVGFAEGPASAQVPPRTVDCFESGQSARDLVDVAGREPQMTVLAEL